MTPSKSTAEPRAVEPAEVTQDISALVTAPDPFDLSKLRLAQNYGETAGVKKLLNTVPVRKPNRQDFVRVHPDPAFRENFSVIELKEDREQYLVGGSELVAELATETVSVTLFTAVNRQSVVFLWPVRLPGPDGKDMDWHRSAREAAAEAMHRWVRVASDREIVEPQLGK